MHKTIKNLVEQKSSALKILVIFLVGAGVAVIVGKYLSGIDLEGSSDHWIMTPIQELKIWHLIFLIMLRGLVSR